MQKVCQLDAAQDAREDGGIREHRSRRGKKQRDTKSQPARDAVDRQRERRPVDERRESRERGRPEHPEHARPSTHSAARLGLMDHPDVAIEVATDPIVQEPRTGKSEERQRERDHDNE